MRDCLFRKVLALAITLLLIGIALIPSINANIHIDNAKKDTVQISEWDTKEILEHKYRNISLRYRYITKNEGSYTDTKLKWGFHSEQVQYYEQEPPLPISTDIGDGNHPPIYIEGNYDFTPENGVTRGSGTEDDPYVIEDWIIVEDEAFENGIFINNTDVYFIIRNCSVSYFDREFYKGIKFENVINGKIEDIEAFRNYDGIVLIDSAYIDIVNCSCHDNWGWYANGIDARYSHHINIISCKCYEMQYDHINSIPNGINLEGISYCFIENCSLYSNWGLGIWASTWYKEYANEYNTIKNCKIYDNRLDGIYLHSRYFFGSNVGGYNKFSSCEIYNNYAGIWIDNIPHNTIENCDIHNNEYRGVEIAGCSYNIVRNCYIYNNSFGVTIWGFAFDKTYAINNKVEHCDIYNNYWGLDLLSFFPPKICYNNIFNNTGVGITVDSFWFSFAKINKNNIYNNGVDDPYGAGLFVAKSFADARNNWWGSVDGPRKKSFPNHRDNIMTILGICIFRPWAKEPIEGAGVQE